MLKIFRKWDFWACLLVALTYLVPANLPTRKAARIHSRVSGVRAASQKDESFADSNKEPLELIWQLDSKLGETNLKYDKHQIMWMLGRLKKSIRKNELDNARSAMSRLTNAAEKLLEQGETKQAEDIARQLVGLANDLEQALIKQDNFFVAAPFYQKTRVELLEARILQARGDYEGAIEAYKRVKVRSDCGNCAAGQAVAKKEGVAECHLELGNYKSAYLMYLSCLFERLDLSPPMKFITVLQQLKPRLSEKEEDEIDEITAPLFMEQLVGRQMPPSYNDALDTVEQLKQKGRAGVEESNEYAVQYAMKSLFLFEEAEWLGLLISYYEVHKAIQAAKEYEQHGDFISAYSSYVDSFSFPWACSKEPVEGIERLRPKLSDSQKQAVDARTLAQLERMMQRSDFENVLLTFPEDNSDYQERYLLASVYPFLITEAERLGLELPVSAAEMRLRIARYYEKIGNAGFAYLFYLKCLDLPWPYADLEVLEGIPQAPQLIDEPSRVYREIIWDYYREIIHKDAVETLQRLLNKREVQEKLAALDNPDSAAITLSPIEKAVCQRIQNLATEWATHE